MGRGRDSGRSISQRRKPTVLRPFGESLKRTHLPSPDPYRAATHNKGILNGIDAVVVATGNDWRAVEAGAHAWAARDGRYRGLTEWQVRGRGGLHVALRAAGTSSCCWGSLAARHAATQRRELPSRFSSLSANTGVRRAVSGPTGYAKSSPRLVSPRISPHCVR